MLRLLLRTTRGLLEKPSVCLADAFLPRAGRRLNWLRVAVQKNRLGGIPVFKRSVQMAATPSLLKTNPVPLCNKQKQRMRNCVAYDSPLCCFCLPCSGGDTPGREKPGGQARRVGPHRSMQAHMSHTSPAHAPVLCTLSTCIWCGQVGWLHSPSMYKQIYQSDDCVLTFIKYTHRRKACKMRGFNACQNLSLLLILLLSNHGHTAMF